MSTREWIAASAAAAALVVVAIVGTGLRWWGGSAPGGSPPVKPIAVRTSLQPRPAFFGDAVAAQIDVQIDPARVSPDTVRVVPGFDPFVTAGAPEVTRTRAGGREVVRYRYTIQCQSEECLPNTKKKETRYLHAVKLPAVVVTATSAGRQLKVKAPWPKMSVLSRMQKGDIGTGTPSFRRRATMPPASYAVSPAVAANILTAAAGALALLAAALVGRELFLLLERRRRRALVQLTPLEEALAFTRDAARRPDSADRRKALELLARTLEHEGVPDLAGTAGDVAWSEEAPSPASALELAERVERATGNGR